MFTCNSTKLTSVPIMAYNSNVHFARNDPFSHLRSHMPSIIEEPLPELSLACAAEVVIGCGSTPPLL